MKKIIFLAMFILLSFIFKVDANIIPSPGLSMYLSTGDLGLKSTSELQMNPFSIGFGLYAPLYDVELQYIAFSESLTAQAVNNDMLGIRLGVKYDILEIDYRKIFGEDYIVGLVKYRIAGGILHYSFINKNDISTITQDDLFTFYIGVKAIFTDQISFSYLFSPHRSSVGMKFLLYPEVIVI